MQTFTSPFLKTRESRGNLLKHLEQAEYAISYHLEKYILKGSIICAIYPKSILQKILPKIAKEKKCTIQVIGTPEQARKFLAKPTNEDPDIYLTEPDGFTQNGILVRPEETEEIKKHNPVAVGSILQWTEKIPATHDCVQAGKTITEKGVYNLEDIEK